MKIDPGIVAALIAAILFGLSTPIAKILVGGMSPLLLAGLLYSGSGIGLALVENVDRRIALGMVCIIGGGVLLSLGPRYRSGNLMGPLAIGAVCLAWAIDNNLTRKVSIHDSIMCTSL